VALLGDFLKVFFGGGDSSSNEFHIKGFMHYSKKLSEIVKRKK